MEKSLPEAANSLTVRGKSINFSTISEKDLLFLS